MTGLRRAVAADAPSLAVLAERTFRDAFGARNSPENMDLHCSKVFGAEIQRREIEDRGLVTTIAEAEHRMIGFSQLRPLHAHASVVAARPAELKRLYVVPEWHGRGVARKLMQDALNTAAGRVATSCGSASGSTIRKPWRSIASPAWRSSGRTLSCGPGPAARPGHVDQGRLTRMYETCRQPSARAAFLRRLQPRRRGACAGRRLACARDGRLYALEGLSALDAFLEIRDAARRHGAGPPARDATGKLFAGFFALYARLAFIATAALLLGPVVHRVLHRFHLDRG